jgi:glutathione S-transferase
MSDIIFHHYDTSPFSELVRLAFGLKDLAWKSVQIPNVAPKPDLTPLTGGYRKTPVMQIGANIYCDSAACIEAIEVHSPAPSLFPQPLGRAGAILGAWAAGPMFMPSVSVAMGPIAHTIPPEFWEDRRKLFGLDTERFGAMGPHLKSQFEHSLARADDALSAGQRGLKPSGTVSGSKWKPAKRSPLPKQRHPSSRPKSTRQADFRLASPSPSAQKTLALTLLLEHSSA